MAERALFRFPKSAAAGRFDAHAIASLEFPTAFGSDLNHAATANDRSFARFSICPTCQPVRTARSSIRQERHVCRSKCFNFTNDAVAAFLFSGSARFFSYAIFAHAQRVGILERFSGRVEAVRHVCVYRANPICLRARTHTAGYRFVIRKLSASSRIDTAMTENDSNAPTIQRMTRASLLVATAESADREGDSRGAWSSRTPLARHSASGRFSGR